MNYSDFNHINKQKEIINVWKHIGDIDDGQHKYGSTAAAAVNRT